LTGLFRQDTEHAVRVLVYLAIRE